MNGFFARLKGGTSEYRLILKQEDLPDFEFFPKPDISAAIEYAPLDMTTQKGQWQYVTLDIEQSQEIIDPYTDGTVNGPQEIDAAEYQMVDVLYRVDVGEIMFKKANSSMKIHENGKQIISLANAGGITIEQTSFGIDFDGLADAVYDSVKRRLYFKSFARARSIFKGVDIFYQEDTLEEKEEFLRNEIFEVGDLNPKYISLRDTQRLAAINESGRFNFEDEETRRQIVKYAHDYPSSGVGVNNEGKLIINDKKDFRAALKLLEQKYFTSGITGEKFEANKTKIMPR